MLMLGITDFIWIKGEREGGRETDRHRCMGDFFPGVSKSRPNFFLDLLPFFFVKLIKIHF